MDAMESRFPGFGSQVFTAGGGVHSFVEIFLNGERVGQEGLGKAVSESDEIEVVAAIAGG